jgi:RimJ/RimL family protein N-acetyltransferase
MDPVEITAGRLHLRPWQPGDAGALLAAWEDEDVRRWRTVPDRVSADTAREYVERTAAARWADGSRLSFAVCDSASGQVLGEVALRTAGEPGVWHLGYWTLPAARGAGVASAAVGALCRWAFAAAGAARVQWLAEAGNWGSRRVAEKAGFTVEGTLRSGGEAGGRRVDCWIGGRLPDDADRDTGAFPSYRGVSDGVVSLRRWRESDAAEVARACADAETARWLPVPVPYREVDGLAYVGGVVPTEWFAGTVANVAVVDAADGALLGAAGLTRRSGIGEVGYWTAPWARGRGVATRAALLHARWGMQELGLPRVELLADVDNAASQRVAEKAGFVREGVLRSVRPAPRDDARRVDMVLYALLAEPAVR